MAKLAEPLPALYACCRLEFAATRTIRPKRSYPCRQYCRAGDTFRGEGGAGVAVELPPGLDCDTRLAGNVAIQADLTLTSGAHKVGFSAEDAGTNLGQIKVLDIGAPPELIARVLVGDA